MREREGVPSPGREAVLTCLYLQEDEDQRHGKPFRQWPRRRESVDIVQAPGNGTGAIWGKGEIQKEAATQVTRQAR